MDSLFISRRTSGRAAVRGCVLFILMSRCCSASAAQESEESSRMAAQGSARFISTLQISDMQGNYTMASESQILAEAWRVIDFRYPEGTEFCSPAVSEDYFRVKLAGFEREVFAVAFLNNQPQLLGLQGAVSREHQHGGCKAPGDCPRPLKVLYHWR